jgi:four helix bundle protein
MNGLKKFDLEERLVIFAVRISNLVESLPNTISGKYLSGQLIRSGLSPALNYGEAKSAESANDFIHKMKIALKELRETFIALQIIKNKQYQKTQVLIDSYISECNELICIFVKSIQTAEKNKNKKKF